MNIKVHCKPGKDFVVLSFEQITKMYFDLKARAYQEARAQTTPKVDEDGNVDLLKNMFGLE